MKHVQVGRETPACPSASMQAKTHSGTSAELFLQHHLALVRLARHFVDDTESAEDVVQDVFTSVHRRVGGAEVTLQYLQSAVINRSRSALRRRRVVRAFKPPRPPDAEAADNRVLRTERYREVITAVDALPRRQREVIVLRYYQDLDTRAIATVLGISQTSVTSALSRAMTRLSRLLADTGDNHA